MAVATTLSGTHLVVDPGQEKSFELLVRNTGDVVDQYTVTVLGRVDRWVKAVPEIVNLMPGTEQTVRLVFDLPKTFEARAGEFPVAIKVASREDPKSTIIDEATVEVTPFTAVTARLDPPKRRGSRSAAYRLVVESRGNEPTPLVVNGYHADEGDQLDVKIAFPEFVADPGTETTLKVRTVPRKRFLRGQPQTLPFVVHVGGEKVADPVVVDGVMIQNPILAPWLLRVLVAAVGVIVALAIWLFFFAPKPTSVATTSAAAKDRGGQQIAEAAPGAAVAPPAAVPPAAPAPTSAPAAAAVPAAAAAPLQPAPPAPATAAAAPAAAAPAAASTTAQAAAAGGPVAAAAATTPVTAPTPAPTTTPAAPPPQFAPTIKELVLPMGAQNQPTSPTLTLTGPVGVIQQYRLNADRGAVVYGPTVVAAPNQQGSAKTVGPGGNNDTSIFQAQARPIQMMLETGQAVVVNLTCTAAAPGATECSAQMTFNVTASGPPAASTPPVASASPTSASPAMAGR